MNTWHEKFIPHTFTKRALAAWKMLSRLKQSEIIDSLRCPHCYQITVFTQMEGYINAASHLEFDGRCKKCEGRFYIDTETGKSGIVANFDEHNINNKRD
jgi:hypothetical protein